MTDTTLIAVDVYDSIQHLYPGLSPDIRQTIAEYIAFNWDYSELYDTMIQEIENYACNNNIDLEGKKGVEEQENNIYVLNPPPSRLFP